MDTSSHTDAERRCSDTPGARSRYVGTYAVIGASFGRNCQLWQLGDLSAGGPVVSLSKPSLDPNSFDERLDELQGNLSASTGRQNL